MVSALVSAYSRTFYNSFPKSGKHVIAKHRGISKSNHIGLYAHAGELWTTDFVIEKMKIVKGDFTGHVYYSEPIEKYLKENGIRTVFIYRDLWDVAVSWNEVMKTHQGLEMPTSNGKSIHEQDDPLSEIIIEVARLWALFSPWMKKASAVYSYSELRGAALLLGNEKDCETFRAGNVGDWRKYFNEHHVALAEKMLPRLKPGFLW